MAEVTIQDLLLAGSHFGHLTRRWNPKMKKFIFMERNGIHIIDLKKTIVCLNEARDAIRKIVAEGGSVLMVGTKKQAKDIIKLEADRCGMPYVTERWLGGTLTNMKTIKRSMGRLREIEKMLADGSIGNYGKQEQSMLRRELARLLKNLDGIRDMEALPSALFVVDIKREHNAVAEAHRLRIPVVAIVDTNCDPTEADYPVAGNDDAIRSVRIILALITQTIGQARAEYEAKHARRVTEAEGAAAETPAQPAAPAVPAAPEGATAPAAEPAPPAEAIPAAPLPAPVLAPEVQPVVPPTAPAN